MIEFGNWDPTILQLLNVALALGKKNPQLSTPIKENINPPTRSTECYVWHILDEVTGVPTGFGQVSKSSCQLTAYNDIKH